MNRRGFLTMLGTGAAVRAVATVAPSQVWPFRKIFLPALNLDDWGLPVWQIGPDHQLCNLMGLSTAPYSVPLKRSTVEVLQAEFDAAMLQFRKGVDLQALMCGQAFRNGNRIFYEEVGEHLRGTIPSLHGINYVQGDMSLENLNHSEVISGSLNEKPASIVRSAARKFVDSLKVSNEDLGWDG